MATCSSEEDSDELPRDAFCILCFFLFLFFFFAAMGVSGTFPGVNSAAVEFAAVLRKQKLPCPAAGQ